MSLVSNGSLNENWMQYICIAAISGDRPNCASSSAARSRASGCLRNSSHTAGEPVDKGPADGRLSRSPLHVTERSPRMFRVPSAFTWPALATPTVIPYCCCTDGSEAVGSMRPNSMGGPEYWSNDGSSVAMATVDVGNFSGDPARTVPVAGAICAPSLVTSWLLTPLYALARAK